MNAHHPQAGMLAAAFAANHPEDVVNIISTAGALLSWGALQKEEHGYAFFTVGNDVGKSPMAVMGVFPASILHKDDEDKKLPIEVIDEVITSLTGLKAKLTAERATKKAAEAN